MFLLSLIAAAIIYLPIVANEPIAPVTATVTGSTFTYTEGASCVVKQFGTDQTVISDLDGWCIYQITPNETFGVEITETSDNPLLPGAVWGFTCTSADVAEEYPQHIYGTGCQR